MLRTMRLGLVGVAAAALMPVTVTWSLTSAMSEPAMITGMVVAIMAAYLVVVGTAIRYATDPDTLPGYREVDSGVAGLLARARHYGRHVRVDSPAGLRGTRRAAPSAPDPAASAPTEPIPLLERPDRGALIDAANAAAHGRS